MKHVFIAKCRRYTMDVPVRDPNGDIIPVRDDKNNIIYDGRGNIVPRTRQIKSTEIPTMLKDARGNKIYRSYFEVDDETEKDIFEILSSEAENRKNQILFTEDVVKEHDNPDAAYQERLFNAEKEKNAELQAQIAEMQARLEGIESKPKRGRKSKDNSEEE